MEELKWPVDICESCGYNLREATPKAAEKSNDANGKLKWTDFCPTCGVGMFVGARVLPKPPEDVESSPILSYGNDEKLETKPEGEPSGVQPDKRGAALAKATDPETQGASEPETVAEGTTGPGGVRPPGKDEYFCTKCASNHKETSKIGKRHSKNREA